MALKLSRLDRIRLMERLASTLEHEMLEEASENEAVVDFRRGWQEAITGQTHPVESLWDDVDAQ
jgi:hypothetical protein